MADTDHIRSVQSHLQRGEKEARAALEASLKDNLAWITLFSTAAKKELRRPSINAKKRRLVLDLISDDDVPSMPKRPRIEAAPSDDISVAAIKASPTPSVAASPLKADVPPPQIKPSKPKKKSNNVIVIESSSESDSEDDNQSLKSVAAVVRDPTKLKVPELRKALSERNLSTFGLKAKLVERLTRALADEKAREARRVTPDEAGVDEYDDDDDAILPRLKSKATKSLTKSATKPTTSTEPLNQPSPDADVAPRVESRVKAAEEPSPELKAPSPVKPASPVKSASPVQQASSPVAIAAPASPIAAKPSPTPPSPVAAPTASMAARVSKAVSEPSPVAAASPPRPTVDSFVDETPMASPERPPPVRHSPGKVRSKERKRKTLFPPESPQSTSFSAPPSDGPILSTAASLKLAERNRALEPKKAIDRAKRKEGLMKMYEEQRRLDEEKRRKTAAQVAAEAERQKQERDAAERRQRETEVARKRAARLQEIQAATDEKRRQLERAEKLRHDQPRSKVETVAKAAASKPRVEIAKPLSSAPSSSAKALKKKPIEAVLLSKKPEPTTYEMSEPESDESGNGEDDTKAVPKWAQKAHLEKALAKQFGPDAIDPTPSIFPEFIATCDLEAIFQPRDGAKKRKFARRTSSGNWLADRPTTRDKVAYKKAMGYTN
ncbi:hypothetical protein SPRG_19685 [Saprolegnia parasitica CBS 223.65]|uniref:SAP domain-containing protein n=1 Tax=Saprolegnia parasitica (strain CBS 223.65) TaxID=695850 RepID=A0A067CWL8_SAPPC|nr:hypothetical protein SPRG_19685 [Saprolegnia parasitica CBS 223.65]KDO30931.1 hypothetical protein SPRG_19685 [Saprolegnia parasitica CBS 223.65]|eukprot:XP_012198634.1 hypothetical protein SPRG_19685 [Saprolegnia parasitica CBS 223.65]